MNVVDYIKQYAGKHHDVPPFDVDEEALKTNMQIADDIIFEVIVRSGGGM